MPEDIYKKIFSKNLNYYMELNKKTQADLINDLGFDKSAVSTWCKGTRLPRMDKIEILSQYFKINRSDLIEEKPKSHKKNVVKEITNTLPDKRLQQIIHCYNEMDDAGRESLADQADYLLIKHPRAKEKEA